MSSLVEILNPFLNSKDTPIERYQASALYDFVEKEAARQKVAVPRLHLIHHDMPNAGGYFHKSEGGHIYITRGYLSRISNNPNLNHNVPTGLKALIAHEMSHIHDMTHTMDSIKFRRYTMYSMPIIALVGYEIYSDVQKRREKEPTKPLPEHFNDMVEDLKKTNFLSLSPVMQYIHADAHEWGKRLAAMTLGLTAGGLTARHISLSSEFRADRAGVIASGFKPDIFIQELKKLEKESTKIFEPKFKEWTKTFADRKFSDQVSEIYKILKETMHGLTYHAHPGEAKRFQAMRDFAASHAPSPAL